jgi:hypothetical protein
MGAFPSMSPASRKRGNPVVLMLTVSSHVSGILVYFLEAQRFIKLKYNLYEYT